MLGKDERAMMNGMDSMMTGVMGFGWLPMLIAVALVIGGAIVLARLLAPGRQTAASTNSIILGVLAAIGGVALVALLAMGPMHFGMRCCG
jgi:hypothetical protein